MEGSKKHGRTFRTLRSVFALCLTLMLLAALSLPAMAATTSGADLRLTATEGTVTLKNSSGKTLSVRDDMKLYSGYVLSTSAKSYAYVSLDSTKVVKLDAGTKVEVRKSGSKLELLVSAGKLFFNVKAPLSSSESLNIRTSTMVTGIRGTSGVVEVLDQETSVVSIYDGKAAVTTANAAAQGGFQTTTVAAGQTGTSLPVGSGSWQVNLEEVTAEDIPGFAAVELAKDSDLQRRIAEDTGLNVDDIVAGAQDRLEQDEAAAQAELDRIAQKVDELPNRTSQATQFAAPQSSGGSSGGSSAPSITPDPPTVVEDYVVSSSITGAELQRLLDTYKTVTVAADGSVIIDAAETVSVPTDTSMTVDGGSFTNNGTLTNNGTINLGTFGSRNVGLIKNAAGGEIHITNDFTNNGTIENSGTIAISAGTFSNENILTGSGSITITGENTRLSNSGTLTVGADGSIVNYTNDSGYNTAGINNFGTILVSGTITNNGWMSNGNGDAASTFGTITIQSGGSIVNSGTIRNYACSDSGNYNTIDIQTEGTLTSNATITNCGQITVSGTLTNNGTYIGSVTVSNSIYTGTVTNNGGILGGSNPITVTTPTP